MLDKETVIRAIENDNDYNECGEYYAEFMNGKPDMRYEYAYSELLKEALASPTKEADHFARLTDTTVKVMIDDDTYLLVKERLSDWNGSRTQFWLVDKVSLVGDIIWENDDR